MSLDPRESIETEPMGKLQILIIGICVLLLAIDGFDVLSVSFASPGIFKEWGITRAALGVVLSMELIGMAFGSMTLGAFADHFGRRLALLGSLLIITLGMFMATQSHNVEQLALYRLLTGLGIGGVLATTNAVAAEFSNRHTRSLCVGLMATGYPLGGVIGGSMASHLLQSGDWRTVFMMGAIATSVMMVLIYGVLPESVGYLLHRQPRDALQKLNQVLAKMGRPSLDFLPDVAVEKRKFDFIRLFEPGRRVIILLLLATYFSHVATFYFMIKWTPKIITDLGFDQATAGGVLVWVNMGGLTGSVILSVVARWIEVKKLVLGSLLSSALAVSLFGQIGGMGLPALSALAALAGFFTNAPIVGLYAIIAHAFPASLRAGGTGLIVGIGRGGAALSPIIAGLIFESGVGLPVVAVVMAAGSLIAACTLYILTKRQEG